MACEIFSNRFRCCERFHVKLGMRSFPEISLLIHSHKTAKHAVVKVILVFGAHISGKASFCYQFFSVYSFHRCQSKTDSSLKPLDLLRIFEADCQRGLFLRFILTT